MSEAPVTPVVFGHTVESLFQRALKGKLPPEAVKELEAKGIDLSRSLLPAYPYQVWIDALLLTAKHVFPGLDTQAALYELGELMVTSYQATFIGGALFAALRVFSLKKVVGRMARNFRTANNYVEVTLRETGATEVELEFNLIEPTGGFTLGILSAGLPAAGIKQSKVELVSMDSPRATYRLGWAA